MRIRLPTDSTKIARAKNDADLARLIVFVYETKSESKLKEWCGEMLPSLEGNFDSLLCALDYPTSKVRMAALLIIRDHWPQLEDLTLRCVGLAFEDPDESVRGVALFVLDRLQDWIDDPTETLTQILWHTTDLDEPEHLRPSNKAGCRAVILDARRSWETVVGRKRVHDMLRSRELTDKCLEDEDHAVRDVALEIMLEWQPTLHAATVAEKRMQDVDPRIRRIAFTIVSTYYRINNPSNVRIRSMLARIVADQHEDAENRFFAYQELCELCGWPIEKSPIMNWLPDEFDADRDTDWAFVNRLLPDAKDS